MDPVEHYLQVFNDLQRRKRWSTGTNFLRFAALTLAASDSHDADVDLEGTAKVLAEEAGGFSPLGSAIRHSVAALLIRRGLDPAPIVHRVKETLQLIKQHKLKRGGTHPVLAALLLVLAPVISSAQWSQIGTDVDGEAEDDLSGTSLAFASGGSLLAVGAYYNDNVNGVDSGHVRTTSDAIFRDGFESGNDLAWSSSIP